MIQILYEQIYGAELTEKNLTDLAAKLADVIGRDEPWNWRYLNGIIKRHKNVSASKDMLRAAQILGARLDGQSDLQARARPVIVYSTNGTIEGSIIIKLHSRRCRWCHMPFLGHPLRLDCCDEHGVLYRKENND